MLATRGKLLKGRKEGGEEEDQPARHELIVRNDDGSRRERYVIILVRSLLLVMSTTVPTWAQSPQPFRMGAEKSGQEVEKEEPLVFSAGPFRNQSCFLTPNAPSTLASDNLPRLDTADDALTREIDLFVDSRNLH
jgi:hypothetical protein